MKEQKKLISYFIIFILIINSLIFIIDFQDDIVIASFSGEDATPPITGNWIIDTLNNIIINETIILTGNLIIKNGGSLTFRNVTLLMNCTSNGTYNIEVESGGQFYIYDYDNDPATTTDSSIITSAIPNGQHRFHFYIQKDANFEMKNSELHECGYYLYDPPGPRWTQGLTIEASNSLIENCIITYNMVGVRLYYYASNSQIINSRISHNMETGLDIWGNSHQHMTGIIIRDSIIASNGQMCSGNHGIGLVSVDNTVIINCSIYHHPKAGIYLCDTKNILISECDLSNNNYGSEEYRYNKNININNNTLVGNLEYAIYSHFDSYLEAQYNYFGTNNEKQIKASIHGNNVNYSNWLEYRESNILYVNTTEEWKNTLKHLDNGLIINGNLTIDNSEIILNNSLGNNFIHVNGKLILKNSFINLNRTNPEIISVYGGYSVRYSYNSSGEFYNSEFQGQKGICINNDDMIISNITIYGNFSFYIPSYGLLIIGENNTIENCNILDNLVGIQINFNSKNNTIRNCNISQNKAGITIIGNYNKIYNNQLDNNGFGIEINGRDYVNISNSTGNYNEIIKNNISNNGGGILIFFGDFNLISNSNISHNDFNGIYILSGINNTITNCNITFNDYEGVCIYFVGSPGSKTPSYNKIYHNNFISNGKNASSAGQAFDSRSTNFWDNGYPGGGNYWDDYTGLDVYSGEGQNISGSDGFGDVPYNIPDKMVKDHYPWMNPNGLTELISAPVLEQTTSPDNDGEYSLSWTLVPNATNYTVYEQLEQIREFDVDFNNFIDFKSKQNGTYHYYVQAKNDYVVSKKSNTISIIVDYPPDIPKNFSIETIPKGNTLNINWSPNKIDTTNYSLWSNSTGKWNILSNISHPNSIYLHTNVSDGIKYYYKLRAWDGRGQSSKFSQVVTGIPWDSVPPSTPTGLIINTISNNSIKLQWEQNNDSDLAGYDIYRSENVNNSYSKINIKPILNNSFIDIPLKSNTLYYYKIQAFDEVPNYSNFSNEVSNLTFKTPLVIVSYSPKGNNVPLNSDIIIIFSKPMNFTSVETAFLIQPIIDGEFNWSEDLRTLTFIPNEYLVENTLYVITILAQAMDIENISLSMIFSWEFKTSSISLPKIISFQPQGKFVSTKTNLSILFNIEMDKDSVKAAFSIIPYTKGKFYWSLNNLNLTFIPDEKLLEITQYFITVNKSAHDHDGKTLVSKFSWNFTTGDFTPPDIISYSPTGKDVAIDSIITIIFSEEMNKTSVQENFKITNNIEGRFDWRENTIVFIPLTNLSYGTTYKFVLSIQATDLYGNKLKENITWEFSTEKSKVDSHPKGENDAIFLYLGIGCIILIIMLLLIFILNKKKLLPVGLFRKEVIDKSESSDKTQEEHEDLSKIQKSEISKSDNNTQTKKSSKQQLPIPNQLKTNENTIQIEEIKD